MHKFVLNLLLFGVLMICAAEIFSRLSGLSSVVMDRTLTKDKMLVFEPNTSGYRTRGMRAEVNAFYRINAQGWNSKIDYDQINSNSIAIVGDSYIAGFWNDVDRTVAACLQQLIDGIKTGVEVHSYGHPGANFCDYENLVTYLRTRGYQKIYVYVKPNDFRAEKATFTNKIKQDKRTGIRAWYLESALLRYLNENLGLQKLLASKMSRESNRKAAITAGLGKKTLARLSAFPDENVVFFYQDDFFDSITTQHQLLKISHVLQPIDHGFDRHWNVNGNRNAAQTIFQHWKMKN